MHIVTISNLYSNWRTPRLAAIVKIRIFFQFRPENSRHCHFYIPNILFYFTACSFKLYCFGNKEGSLEIDGKSKLVKYRRENVWAQLLLPSLSILCVTFIWLQWCLCCLHIWIENVWVNIGSHTIPKKRVVWFVKGKSNGLL